jgi:hypothetical protein
VEAEGIAQLGSSHGVRGRWALQAPAAVRSGAGIISLPLTLLRVLLQLLLAACCVDAANLWAVRAAWLQHSGAGLRLDAAAEIRGMSCRAVTGRTGYPCLCSCCSDQAGLNLRPLDTATERASTKRTWYSSLFKTTYPRACIGGVQLTQPLRDFEGLRSEEVSNQLRLLAAAAPGVPSCCSAACRAPAWCHRAARACCCGGAQVSCSWPAGGRVGRRPAIRPTPEACLATCTAWAGASSWTAAARTSRAGRTAYGILLAPVAADSCGVQSRQREQCLKQSHKTTACWKQKQPTKITCLDFINIHVIVTLYLR